MITKLVCRASAVFKAAAQEVRDNPHYNALIHPVLAPLSIVTCYNIPAAVI